MVNMSVNASGTMIYLVTGELISITIFSMISQIICIIYLITRLFTIIVIYYLDI